MNAAVFVDFENLFGALRGRAEVGDQRVRDVALGVLQGLVGRLRENGVAMLIGRSYAAFDNYPGSEVAHDLALLGLDPQYVLVGHSGRNSADIQLTFDVARVLFRRGDIGMIVVVSGDRDFLPVARQVLEEGRELRLVSIMDATSGDLRARVGADRFWDAMELAGDRLAAQPVEEPQAPPPSRAPTERIIEQTLEAPAPAIDAEGPSTDQEPLRPSARGVRRTVRPPARERAAVVVGRIPVTWGGEATPQEHEDRLMQCVELMIRSRLRHGSKEVWLSPFLKGAMSQHFAHIVHPERRAMINELRDRGVLRIEERENLYADHPYSVIVLDDEHTLVRAAWSRVRVGGPPDAFGVGLEPSDFGEPAKSVVPANGVEPGAAQDAALGGA